MLNAPDGTSWREGRSSLRAAGLVLFFYALTRVASLHVLPMFLDEAVHLQWAERLYGEGRVLRPVGSGRLLAVAAYGLALPFEDRLWTARLIATVAGAATLVLTVLVARRLFGDRAALVSGLLYILSPFALVYDRLALSDGFLCVSITGLMLATWELANAPGGRPRRRMALTALFVALAVLSKVSALLFFLTVPLGVLALSRDRIAALRAAGLAIALGLVLAAPMLWFFAANSGEISGQHIVDPANALAVVAATLRDMRGWALSYFTIPVILVAALGAAVFRDGRALWLGGSVVLPFILFAGVSEPWSARYVLPVLPPLLILTAGGIDALGRRVKGRWATGALIGLVSASTLPFDWDLLTDPSRAPFPDDDLRQLVTDWPAGYGVRELAIRLKHEAITGPITVFVDSGGLRTVPTSLAVLLGREANLNLVEGDFASLSLRDSMISRASEERVFAITCPRSTASEFDSLLRNSAAARLEIFVRPGGEWAATLFRVGKVR